MTNTVNEQNEVISLVGDSSGKEKWIRTTCSMCYARCGIRVKVVDGVAVKIEGEPESTFGAEGGLCGKGVAGLQLLYDPNRLSVPLRRTNPEKGLHTDPKWKEITWEEALDEIAERLRKIKREDPRKLLLQGTTIYGSGVGMVLGGIWARIFGTPNFFEGGGGLHCGAGAHTVTGIYYGSWSALPDFKYCNYTILFGASKGHAAGHSSGMTIRLAAEARARGMKMVAIDPMCHGAGGKATEWVSILPGTDGAVAIAMLNVIVNELGIWDADFLKKKTNAPYLIGPDGLYVRDTLSNAPLVWDIQDGKAKPIHDTNIKDYALEGDFEVRDSICQPAFQKLKKHIEQYTPEMASEVSTIPAKTIRRIATEFAQAASIGSTIEINGRKLPFRPVSAVIFRGAEGHTNSMHTCFAVHMLNIILGAADVPGGTLGFPARSFGYPETGRRVFKVEGDEDGFLRTPKWPAGRHRPFGYPDPKLPSEQIGMQDLFTMFAFSPFYCSSDQEEMWQKAGLAYRPEMVINVGLNVPLSIASQEAMAHMYERIPFIASFDIYLTEFTCGFADIVLPDVSYLERLGWCDTINIMFNAPTGEQDWVYAITQPIIQPPGQRRLFVDVMFELADRLGLRTDLNNALNRAFELEEKERVQPEEKIGWEQLGDRVLRSWFGSEHGLDWFKEHGFLRWPKKVEEAYWRQFVDARVPIYFEWITELGKHIKKLAESAGINVDWQQYTPYVSWFPTPVQKQSDPQYDLYCFSYRDILHTGSMTMELPWLDEASEMNPYTYNVTINADVARAKGLDDGDIVWLETAGGRKQQGRLRLMEGQHPQTVGIAACSGHWVDTLPVAKGKGANFDDLIPIDLEHTDPVCGNLETCVKVKITKIVNSKDGKSCDTV